MIKLVRFFEAWLTLTWVDIQVSYLPYSYWRDELTHGLQANAERHERNERNESSVRSKDKITAKEIRVIIAISESARRRHFRHMNCLRRCLAQSRILQRRGVTASMHIGVAKTGDQLNAHAWLCYGGQLVNDSVDVTERYTELESLSSTQIESLLT